MDEVAAQHVDADAMVHYGHACMSLYVSAPMIPRLFDLFFGVEHRDYPLYMSLAKRLSMSTFVSNN